MLDTGKLTKTQVDAFLEKPLMARLATAVPSKDDPRQFQPHNVPVWFYWDGEHLFISAFQSTRKVKELKRNPYIAVLIDVMDALDGVTAVLFEGKAELILDPPTVAELSGIIYTRYMGEEGVLAEAPQSWMVDPENAIIRLTPAKLLTW
ncbi:MAG: pyridoxamine 5'-phosphate oxidase family protein [Anaerolineaceae bacterium]|nr:pyridoxamine 5'-phosphate oxidase family protein [Anaerolineaceae bacterium]